MSRKRGVLKHRGLTLFDCLVLLAILIVVLALVLLRMSGSRESSRRMECEEKLRKVFLGTESYALRYGHFPIGTQNESGPIRSEAEGYHHNWITGLLPMMDREATYDQIDFSVGVYAPENEPVGKLELPELLCPASATTLVPNTTSYVGVTSSTETPIDESGDGMFLLNRPLSQRDAVDGAGYVWLLGEKARDFGPPMRWNSGTRTSLRTGGHRINEPTGIRDAPTREDAPVDELFVGGFSSNHIGGAYFLFVDGSFRFYSDETDLKLVRQMSGRDDRAIPESGKGRSTDQATESLGAAPP